MSLETIIGTYGYAALLVGTFLEGETILIIGGFAAHRGYISLPLVILSAFIGTLAGDQLFFFIGRKKGKAFLDKRPSWKPNTEKAQRLLEQYQTLLVIGFRFLYGFRTVTPFVIGMSRIRTGRFIVLNILGALSWAIIIGSGGYLFGLALETLIVDLKRYELEAIAVISVIGAMVWLVRFWRGKRVKTD